MRLATTFFLLPLPASAHTGHLGELAGHDHWVAGAAVGVAVGLGLWQWAKDRKKAADAPRSDELPEDCAAEEAS